MRAVVVLSAAADTLSFLVMGVAHEANPLVAAHPTLAVVAKCGLAALLLAWPYRYASPLRLIAASAWTFGALSNALVIWR